MIEDEARRTHPSARIGEPAQRQVGACAELPCPGPRGDGAGRINPQRPPSPWLRSYGRRRGRRLSARQETLLQSLLPRVALVPDSPPPARLADLFGENISDVWLEIGFGGGEHLLWQAKHNRQVGIIGCEPFRDGIIKVLTAIADDEIGNVRVFADDARLMLQWLPEGSIGRAFLLFPDPWPKKRHHKRRLVGAGTLAALGRVMRPSGELRIATDVGAYAAEILNAVGNQGDFALAAPPTADPPSRPQDWPATRYEQKARRGGHVCHFFTLRRV